MNARHTLVCSLLVNVALCAAASHLFHLRRPQGFVVPLKRTIKTVTNEFTVSKSPAPAPSEPRVRLTEFQWALIESEDYATYIHNLRAIGCPEKTIRDIIAGEIDRLFDARRRALISEADNFWTTKSARAADDFEHARFLASLAAEKESLQSDLEGLGIDVRQSQFDFDAPSVEEWVAAPFGAEKQTRLRQIHRRFVRAFEALHAEAGGMLTVEEDARVARLLGQLRREIDTVLAASERQEYWVRHAAFDLQVAGFSGTEQQYRGLALLQRDMNLARMDLANDNPPAGAVTSAQLQRDFDEKARELLGAEAYAEFVRARDPDFHQLQQFAEENQLSSQVAVRTYDLRRAAERELDRIRADDRLSADERRVALELVRRQTEQALRATLSSSTLQAYFRTAGRWVQSIYP